MGLSDTSARVRLNMERSPLECQGDRSKQRRVLEGPDEDDVKIGEVQAKEEVVNILGQRFQQQNLAIGKRENTKGN